MALDFVGLGTAVNVGTIVLGALTGRAVGHRLSEHSRALVTDCLGLVSLLMAATNAMMVTDSSFAAATGRGAPMLIVLGSLVIGSLVGGWLRIEAGLERLAGVVQRRFGGAASDVPGDTVAEARDRFVQGWMTASLLFCVGPLTILGSLNDGLGRGIDQLVLKSVLDGFAALAFASTFGIGVLFSAVSVAVVQGSLTVAGFLLGSVLPDAHLAALTATGGLMLAALSFRLLDLKQIAVGDMLPALLVAPLLTQVVIALR